MLESKPKRYRYPLELISIGVWSYHQFNDSYRDVSERLLYRGIDVSYETIRQWCIKFGPHFKSAKSEPPGHRINGTWMSSNYVFGARRIIYGVPWMMRAMSWMCFCKSGAIKRPSFASGLVG